MKIVNDVASNPKRGLSDNNQIIGVHEMIKIRRRKTIKTKNKILIQSKIEKGSQILRD